MLFYCFIICYFCIFFSKKYDYNYFIYIYFYLFDDLFCLNYLVICLNFYRYFSYYDLYIDCLFYLFGIYKVYFDVYLLNI